MHIGQWTPTVYFYLHFCMVSPKVVDPILQKRLSGRFFLFSIRQRVSACGDLPLRSPPMYTTLPRGLCSPQIFLCRLVPYTSSLCRFHPCAICCHSSGEHLSFWFFFVVPTINHLPLFKPTARLWHILIFFGGFKSSCRTKDRTVLLITPWGELCCSVSNYYVI